jgi:hypothetical protein
LKFTPYIYSLFFISFYFNSFSQEYKTLIIKGSDIDSDFIVSKISYHSRIKNDSLFRIELKKIRKKINLLGFTHHKQDTAYQNNSIYYASYTIKKPIKKIIISYPNISVLSKDIHAKLIDSTHIQIPFDKIQVFIKQLITNLQNNGYPFARINLTSIKYDNETITADLHLIKNSKRSIDKIVVKGYTHFPLSYIKHYLKLKNMSVFDKKKISQIPERIQQIPFASEIKKPEMLFTNESTALYLYLKKEKSNYFDGLIGLSNSRSNNALQLNGHLNLQIQNTLDHGESLKVQWHSDGNQKQALKLTIETPYILNSPLSPKYSFDIYKQDTTFVSISNYLSIDYQVNNNHGVGLVLSYNESNKILSQSEINTSNFTSIFYGFSYKYFKANNHQIFDKKFELYSEVTQGERNKRKQNKISNYLSYLFLLSENKNILIKNKSELLLSNTYYNNELYRIGGSNSIRGFGEKSLIAKSYSYLNIEYNYLINNSSFISILTDTGILDSISSEKLLVTYSFGIGYNTKSAIGNIGIQYFIGNTNNTSFSFSNSKLHIKLSRKF